MFDPKQPTSYQELYELFGDPNADNFADEHIVSNPHVIANGQVIHISSHKLIVDHIHGVFVDLISHGLVPIINTYDGCYVNRDIRGSSNKSLHAWGLALDFDAAQYHLGSYDRLPQSVIDIFKAHGFFYGGDFIHRKDPMHFEYSTGII